MEKYFFFLVNHVLFIYLYTILLHKTERNVQLLGLAQFQVQHTSTNDHRTNERERMMATVIFQIEQCQV